MFTLIKLFITLSFGMLLLVGSGDSSDTGTNTNTTENNTTNTTTNTTSNTTTNTTTNTNTTTENTNTIVDSVTTDNTTTETDSTVDDETDNNEEPENNNSTDTDTNTSTDETNETEVNNDATVWNVSTISQFRQALENAAANGENDRIVLAKGTYNVTSDKLGTLTFDDAEEYNLTIQAEDGLTSKDVVLTGNSTEQVFNFKNKQNSVLILKDITVTGGYSTTHGGGVYSDKNIHIEDCNISNNRVNGSYISGAGFYVNNFSRIENSTISDNHNDDYNGGGFTSGSTEIANSDISNNTSGKHGGGFASNKVTITNSTILNNSSKRSGGGFIADSTTVTNSTISKNTSGEDGGGLYAGGKTTISDSNISNNTSGEDGGGIYTHWSTITLNNSIVSKNSTTKKGGGCHALYSITIINSKFVDNNALEGAICYSRYSSRTSYFSNNTFINNKGSIKANGIFINNIFDDNDEAINLNEDSKIYNNYIDYTKIEDNGFNALKKSNLQPASVGNINLASDNQTLTADSPVIDKGLNPSSTSFKKLIDDETYEQIVELLKTDLIGNKRIHNGTIDIGAVEFGSSK